MADKLRDRILSAFKPSRTREPAEGHTSPSTSSPPDDVTNDSHHQNLQTPGFVPGGQSEMPEEAAGICACADPEMGEPEVGEGSWTGRSVQQTVVATTLHALGHRGLPNFDGPSHMMLPTEPESDAHDDAGQERQQTPDLVRVTPLGGHDQKGGTRTPVWMPEPAVDDDGVGVVRGSRPCPSSALQDDHHDLDLAGRSHFGSDVTQQAGPSSGGVAPVSCDCKRLKFLLPVEGRRKTPPPHVALACDSFSDFSSKLSPSPPPTSDSSLYQQNEEGWDSHGDGEAEGEMQEEVEEEVEEDGGVVAGEGERRGTNSLIGDDGLLNVFALRQDINRRTAGLNKRFLKYRVRQETIHRLLRCIQHLMRETEVMNSLLAASTDQIGVLARDASDRRDELAAVCDVAAVTVGKSDIQIQGLEPTCYKRYLNIRNNEDCLSLLTAVRNKKKALADLEILIHRKQLIQHNALPVTVKDDPPTKSAAPTKKASKLANRMGRKTSKFNKMMVNKGSEFKPIVLEAIASPIEVEDSADPNSARPEQSTTPEPPETPPLPLPLSPPTTVSTAHSTTPTTDDTGVINWRGR